MSNLTAHFSAWHDHDVKKPAFADVVVKGFETREEAAAFIATFPKSLRLSVGGGGVSFPGYSACLNVNLQPKKGNARNDAGIKRLDTFLAKLAKAKIPVLFRNGTPGLSYYASEAELDAAIR